MDEERRSKSDEVRSKKRENVELKAIVQGHSSPDEKWKETIMVENVSRSGASFHLGHECQIGTLLTIVLPLPLEMRAYDFTENVYPLIGLVQYCTETVTDGTSSFKVGVAFVGKTFPDSFSVNPLQNYHITGSQPSGIWKIAESSSPFSPRGDVRYWAPADVALSLFQREDRRQSKEDARALNISSSGALVVSSLRPEKAERVKLGFKEHNFYTLAEVRHCRLVRAGKWAIHLAFIESRFPVTKIRELFRKDHSSGSDDDHSKIKTA